MKSHPVVVIVRSSGVLLNVVKSLVELTDLSRHFTISLQDIYLPRLKQVENVRLAFAEMLEQIHFQC
jgi:hypothetical protein